MICKKGTHEKCMCLKRKCDGCIGCEKEAIRGVVKTGKGLHDTYVRTDGLTGVPSECWFRSAVDILRGVCDYCKHDNWQLCNGCMWMNGNGDEDHWAFDERLLKKE